MVPQPDRCAPKKMKKLKTKYEYHDSLIMSVVYPRDEDVVLEVDLCGFCSGLPDASVHILFNGVRNLPEVRQSFDQLCKTNKAKGYIAEIVGILRADSRGFLLDLSDQAVVVDSKGFIET